MYPVILPRIKRNGLSEIKTRDNQMKKHTIPKAINLIDWSTAGWFSLLKLGAIRLVPTLNIFNGILRNKSKYQLKNLFIPPSFRFLCFLLLDMIFKSFDIIAHSLTFVAS